MMATRQGTVSQGRAALTKVSGMTMNVAMSGLPLSTCKTAKGRAAAGHGRVGQVWLMRPFRDQTMTVECRRCNSALGWARVGQGTTW